MRVICSFCFVFSVLFPVGCAGRSSVSNNGVAISTSGPTAEIESHLLTLQNEHYDVLAPQSYERARKQVEEARNLSAKNGDSAEIEKKITEARMELQHADKMGSAADASLKDVLVARETALIAREKAEAAGMENPEALKRDFGKAHNHMIDLAKDLENNEVQKVASQRNEVIEEFHAIEDKAIQKENIDVAKRLAERARSQGASRYAPTTLKETEETLNDAEAFLRENPHSEEAKQHGGQALNSAEHLLRVTLESKRISQSEPETTALWIERNISGIEGEMGIGSPQTQHLSYSERFESMQSALNQMTDEQKGLAAESDELRSEIARTKPPAEIDSKVKQLQVLFAPKEAEVIREGDQIIVRMKGLTFPAGKATLTKKNNPLLGKIEAAVEIFPNSKVVIEGHTDSTGNSAVNETISKSRADAVRDYLVENETLSEDEVVAVGKGSTEPLDANDSPKGRAVNRRVDIVIEPAPALAE